MKFFLKIIVAILFMVNITNAQIKVDTLLGENGLFKRYKPKAIADGDVLQFNMVLHFAGVDSKEKEIKGQIYLNTTHGYYGITDNAENGFDANAKDFVMTVYSSTMQNFTFKTGRKGKKTVMSLPMSPINRNAKIEIQKTSSQVVKLAKYNLSATPYKNGKGTQQGLLYFTDVNLSSKSNFKNMMAYASLGFYEVSNKTILCMRMEMGKSHFTITDINNCNATIKMSEFKKETSGISQEMMDEMMKKLKKN